MTFEQCFSQYYLYSTCTVLVALAYFQCDGILPVEIVRLKRQITGLVITETASLRSFAGILSSPLDLNSFSFASSLRTKLISTACRAKSFSWILGTKIWGKAESLKTLHKFLVIGVKNVLNIVTDSYGLLLVFLFFRQDAVQSFPHFLTVPVTWQLVGITTTFLFMNFGVNSIA